MRRCPQNERIFYKNISRSKKENVHLQLEGEQVLKDVVSSLLNEPWSSGDMELNVCNVGCYTLYDGFLLFNLIILSNLQGLVIC